MLFIQLTAVPPVWFGPLRLVFKNIHKNMCHDEIELCDRLKKKEIFFCDFFILTPTPKLELTILVICDQQKDEMIPNMIH